jgi:hypothetical protein
MEEVEMNAFISYDREIFGNKSRRFTQNINYKIDWKALKRFCRFKEFVLLESIEKEILLDG